MLKIEREYVYIQYVTHLILYILFFFYVDKSKRNYSSKYG